MQKEEIVRDLIGRDLNLSGYTLGYLCGLPKICLAIWPFVKEEARAAIANFVKNRAKRDLEVAPLAHTDPIGYAITSCPSLYPKRLLEQLVHCENPHVILNDHKSWNRVHLDTLMGTLEIMMCCCRENKVTGRARIDDSSLEKRLLDQRRHLRASGYDWSIFEVEPDLQQAKWSDFERRRYAALQFLEVSGDRGLRSRISKNWWDPVIHRIGARKVCFAARLREFQGIPEIVRRSAIVDLASIPDIEASSESSPIEHHLLGQQWPSQERRKHLASFWMPSLSAISPPQHPGRSLAEEICGRAKEECENDPGAAAAAMLITAALPPKLLEIAKFKFLNGSAIISTPATHPTVDTYVDSELHIGRTNEFCRFSTVRLAQLTLGYLEIHGPILLNAKCESWLKEIHRDLTLSRLGQSLRYQFPVWFNVPAIYYEIGLNSSPKSIVGWRSYVLWNPKAWAHRVTAMMHRFDPDFQLPDDLAERPSCGSAFTPRPEKIRKLFSFLKQALHENVLASDLDSLTSKANAVASCARLVEGLFTFSRGRDATRSLRVIEDGIGHYLPLEDYRIINEKRYPRVITFPKVAKQILCRVRGFLDRSVERMRELGSTVECGEVNTGAVYFLEATRDGPKTLLVPPTRARVALGLYDCEETRQFASLHPHSMRNLSNFLLRSSGQFSDAVVHALHDHYPSRRRGPLDRLSMRVPILHRQRERAAEFIAHELELY